MVLFNTAVLMSGAEYLDDSEAINPFMTQDSPINHEGAIAEHNKIRDELRKAGVEAIQTPAPANCQDGVYTANWALVRGDTAVLASLPSARKAEETYAATTLQRLGKKIIHLPQGLRFSGQGDALPCGDYLFCGSTYRTDIAAQEFAANTLGYERIQLQTVPLLDKNGKPVINKYSGWPDSFFYDIDLALSVLKVPSTTERGLIAWCPAAFTPESRAVLRAFDKVDKIEVSEGEAKSAFACNLVSTGKTVIMNKAATQLATAIESRGLKTVLLSNPELGKGGGSIRCTTLTFND